MKLAVLTSLYSLQRLAGGSLLIALHSALYRGAHVGLPIGLLPASVATPCTVFDVSHVRRCAGTSKMERYFEVGSYFGAPNHCKRLDIVMTKAADI